MPAWRPPPGRRDSVGSLRRTWSLPTTYQPTPIQAKFPGFPGTTEARCRNSMTGFGAAEGSVAGGRLRVEIRTVNHRYFNLAAKLPADLGGARGRAARAAAPGVRPRSCGGAGALGGVSRARRRVRAWISTGRGWSRRGSASCRSALGLSGDVTLELVARQPEVLSTSRATAAAEVPWAEVEPIVAQAAAECRAMRAREGEALATELRHRLELLEHAADGHRAAGPGAAGTGAGPAAGGGRGAARRPPGGRHAPGPGDRVPGRPARHHRGAGPLPAAHRGGARGAGRAIGRWASSSASSPRSSAAR